MSEGARGSGSSARRRKEQILSLTAKKEQNLNIRMAEAVRRRMERRSAGQRQFGEAAEKRKF